jgi:hypothetical protein
MPTTIAATMNDALERKRSRCVADGQRHASNIADDDKKSIWIGKKRAEDEQNRTNRKLK